MFESEYQEIDKLISEYEKDVNIIRSEKLIMKNYPKILTLSAASIFEKYIKERCQEFVDNPILPLSSYPKILELQNRNRRPLVDKMFAKLEAYNSGTDHLDASKFYCLFGEGEDDFENILCSNFESQKTKKLQKIESKLQMLQPLANDDAYIISYLEQEELKDQISLSNFKDAEKAYLEIKLRRNKVAHNYLDGLYDTFSDVQKFYNLAVIYIIALEETIYNLTKHD